MELVKTGVRTLCFSVCLVLSLLVFLVAPMPAYAAEGNETRVGILSAAVVSDPVYALTIDGKRYEISDNVDGDLRLEFEVWLLNSSSVPVEYTVDRKGEIIEINKISRQSYNKIVAAKNKKAASPAGQQSSAAAQELRKLANKSAVGLDATLSYYFSDSQISEIRDFLQLWVALITTSQDVEYSDLDDKIVKKVLSKLGISTSSFIIQKTTEGSVKVKAKTLEGEDATVEFYLDIASYVLGETSPFGSTGRLEYTVKGCKSEGHPTEGTGLVTFADMETFCNQVASIANSAIKNAQYGIWGKTANKVAAAFINGPMEALLSGSFSNGVYTLLTAPTNGYLKEHRVKCPVDVYVYDSSGDLCASVVNNVVVNDEGVQIYVVDEEKRFFLEGDDYSIRLVGTAEGVMDYEIVEYDDDVAVRTVITNDVSLENGSVYYAYSPDVPYADNAMYSLEDEAGNEIAIDGDTYQDLRVADPYDELDDLPQGQCGDAANWLIVEGTLYITGEGEIEREQNEAWGWSAFRDKITRVIIDEGITAICGDTFEGFSQLSSVDLPDTLALVDGDCFKDCSALAAISLPNGLGSIGEGVFSGCSSLSTITLPNGLAEIGDRAFSGCSALSALVIPDSVKLIGDYAFEDCVSLTSLTLPINGCELESYIIKGCESLTELYIPNGIMSTKEVSEAGGYTQYQGHYVKTHLFGSLASSNLNTVILDEETTVIPDALFQGCDTLKTVELPDGLKTISEYAFAGCRSLEELHLPDGVEAIETEAFVFCDSLMYINMPSSIKSITGTPFIDGGEVVATGDEIPHYSENLVIEGYDHSYFWAWYQCGDAGHYDTPGTYVSMGSVSPVVFMSGDAGAFHWELDSALKLTISGQGAMPEYENAADYSWSKVKGRARSLVVESGVTSVASNAFASFNKLENVNLPPTIISIGEGAFSGCTGLREIDFPENLETIGSAAFSECSSLQTIAIPDKVVEVEWRAFEDCVSLSEVSFGAGVQRINVRAFSGCTSLERITKFPIGLTVVDQWAFERCESLSEVHYEGVEWAWNKLSVSEGNECLLNASIHFGNAQLPDDPDPGDNAGLGDCSVLDANGNEVSRFASFDDALLAASEGQTILLHSNIALYKQLIIDKPITIEGDGYGFYVKEPITEGPAVVIRNISPLQPDDYSFVMNNWWLPCWVWQF